jgi:SAM-dependent methyltransferase
MVGSSVGNPLLLLHVLGRRFLEERPGCANFQFCGPDFVCLRVPPVKRLGSNTDWERWGDTDPLWGVAAWSGKQIGAPGAWREDDFYELGRSDWADFVRRWERYGVTSESCVEIGCGAGRITKQLVAYFTTVHAIDVSEGMLAYARPRIAANFYRTDGVHIPLGDASVAAAFSSHVLQHLDSADEAVPIFAEVFRVLRPDGTMMVHLPVYELPFRELRPLIRIRRLVGQLRAEIRRRRGQMLMRGTWYEVRWLFRTLGGIGFADIEIVVFPTAASYGLHSFVLARRPHSDH